MKVYEVKVYDDGKKEWYLNDKLHREDGPAIECINNKFWYFNGLLHRVDVPAAEYADGTKAWYLHDELFSEEEFNLRMSKKQSSCSGKIVEIDGKKYKLTEV